VGMSTRALTPMLFTVSTLIFPIPAYILRAISRSTNMSTKTKKMHESFMKALLYTAFQPTLVSFAILITCAQNLKLFEASELSESLITLTVCLSSLLNPLATLYFVRQYKTWDL
ncbi:hypothetical protein PENTCL1PPCAC_17078, partial [Pristionchus entomophagus]